MTDTQRVVWLKRIVVCAFIFGVFVANHLWIADRLYPLNPALRFFSLIPSWIDYALLATLLVFLSLAAFSVQSKKYIIISLIVVTFLFLEDRQRLFPSFYEYVILLFVFSFYKEGGSPSNARSILNLCRLLLVFVYFWSGTLKINPFFKDQLSWVLLPLSNFLPFIRGPILSWGSIFAPLIEAEIGVGLIFKKTRDFALAEAIFVHGILLFLIGPLRGNWNDSAWAWNLASLFLVCVLFFRADDVSANEIVFRKNILVGSLIVLLVGILPAFNLTNRWDSALSFNVYSGNISTAKINVESALTTKLSKGIQTYVNGNPEGAENYLDFNFRKWSEDELNAEPIPETRIFKNIAANLCAYATTPDDVRLTVHEKLSLTISGWSRPTDTHYNCATLQPHQ